jgi:uncharacterized protein DUF1236
LLAFWNRVEPKWNLRACVGLILPSTALEEPMKNRIAISLVAASLLASSAAFAQSTTSTGEIVGSTVGAAAGAAVEVPNAVVMSIEGQSVPSVTLQERVVVGQPLPEQVDVWPVPHYAEYSYAVVNDQRVIVDPKTRKVIRIVEARR